MAKWVRKWRIPIQKNTDRFRTVAIDENGNYGCNCPDWIFYRENCLHILMVKNGRGEEIIKPLIKVAQVTKPTFVKGTNELLVPFVRNPDFMMMEATICFNMIKHGYSFTEIRELRKLSNKWTAKAVREHIEENGEAEYKPEQFDSKTKQERKANHE